MELNKKKVSVSQNGKKKITVCEASWDYSFRFDQLDKSMETAIQEAQLGAGFEFFCKNYYPLMASCVEGEVPTPQEAFEFPRMCLDNWYLAFWELNEDIIGIPYLKTMEQEEVVFRDGSIIHVWRANGLPSFLIRLAELESHATDHPVEDDPQGQLFNLMFYPKMVAACNGSDIPDAASVRNWPRSEINKWLEASRRMNPDWFQVTELPDTEKKKETETSAG